MMMTGDAATGTQSLLALYSGFASKHVEMDLQDLFAKLGVIVGGAGRISFDGKAPLASLRRRLTTQGARRR
jgi:hypothetical protein